MPFPRTAVGPHCSALGPRVVIPLKNYSYAYYLPFYMNYDRHLLHCQSYTNKHHILNKFYLLNATLVDYEGYPGAVLFLLPCQHTLAETEAACHKCHTV